MRYLLILAFLSLTGPACADISVDTNFVVMKQMEAFEDAKRLGALSDQAIAALEPAIEKFGATIIDRAAFKDVLLGDTYDEMFEMMRTAWVEQYSMHLTPAEIAALAEFYRSDVGKTLAATFPRTGDLPRDAHTLLNGPLKPVLENYAQMQAGVSDREAQIKEELSRIFALDRFSEVFAMKDIIGFESEARRQEVVDAFEVYLTNQ
ncbi:MAG: DUF2059 domain-containing protein [Pseudomonadota bacterium]